MKGQKEAGFGAIPLLVALLVVAFILVAVIGHLAGRPGRDARRAGRPIERVQAVDCLSRVRRVQMQVEIYGAEYGQYPEGLERLGGSAETEMSCPVTQQPYEYDPSTGRVRCPDHPR